MCQHKEDWRSCLLSSSWCTKASAFKCIRTEKSSSKSRSMKNMSHKTLTVPPLSQKYCKTQRSLTRSKAQGQKKRRKKKSFQVELQSEHLAAWARPSSNSSALSNHIQISAGLLALTEAQRSGCNNSSTYPSKYHTHYVYFAELWRSVSAEKHTKSKVMKQSLSTQFELFFNLWSNYGVYIFIPFVELKPKVLDQ